MNWEERYAEYRPQFERGMDPRFYTIAHLDWLLVTGAAAIWFSDNAALVCEIRAYPTGVKAGHAVIAAGDMDEITEQLVPQAENWARDNGCAFAVAESREGWGKRMKRHGYAPFQYSLVKEL